MSLREWYSIRVKQCEAARDVKARYRLEAAFDNLITEAPLNFTVVAANHLEFARELPQFISGMRRTFTSEQSLIHIARAEREFAERGANTSKDDEDDVAEHPATVAEEERCYPLIRKLLTVPDLGTS